MTKEQVKILLTSAETLQKDLEREFEKNMVWAKEALTEKYRLHYETRANSYRSLMLVNAVKISAYQTMLKMAGDGFPVFSKTV